MTSVTIPGLKPGDDIGIQNHLLNIDTDFQLEPAADSSKEERKLRQKIVAHILIKAAQWRQVDVVTDVHFFPRFNSMGGDSVPLNETCRILLSRSTATQEGKEESPCPFSFSSFPRYQSGG